MDTSDHSSSPQISASSSNDLDALVPGETKDERIDVPLENDVLCGRGGSINSHKGNEQFRDLVEKRKRVYLTARFKREKRLIASSIVSEIRAMDPPGRFLARKGNKDQGYWYDIGDEKARDKTSQALRENAPSIRAEIETEINEQRADIKRKETGAVPQEQPSHPFSAPIPHQYYSQSQHQSYWDWYYHYYGYPVPAVPPHYPPPPHTAGAPPHPTLPHAPPGPAPHPTLPHAPPGPPPHPTVSAHQNYWGQHSAPVPPQPLHHREKVGEEFKEDEFTAAGSQQESEDYRMAMELQHQENATAYEARKARYLDSRSTRSNAFVTPGFNPRSQIDKPSAKSQKFHPTPPSSDFDSSALTQEQRDHRLAVALQEQEDSVLRNKLHASSDTSRRTSRSNAYSQATRINREAIMSSLDTSTTNNSVLDQNFPASLVAWVTADSSSKPKHLQRRRSVQFKEDDENRSSSQIPASLQRQSSVASAETRPLQPQAEQNSSLLYQVASHILGSWETQAPQTERKPPPQDVRALMDTDDDEMEAEGLEVQLRDAGNETSMPPPEPRVQIDWPSKVGSCHTWIPETLGAAWGSTLSIGGGSGHHGISSVNSLEMEGSNNMDHGSVGGGSLTHLFENDESLQRALREVPSWERSMQLSVASVERDEASFVRRGDYKVSKQAAQSQFRYSGSSTMFGGSGNMDWECHPGHG